MSCLGTFARAPRGCGLCGRDFVVRSRDFRIKPESRLQRAMPAAKPGRLLRTGGQAVERDATSEYLELLRRALSDWKPLLLEELSRVLEARFHPEVDLLHFEFFDDAICEPHFPFFVYSYRKQDGIQSYSTPMPTARKVFEVPADAGFFPGWYPLLGAEKRALIDPDVWTAYAEETDYEFLGAESQMVHDWFVACWQEVAGSTLPMSAYLLRVYADEQDEGFDLRSLQPVTWLEVWQ